MKCALVLVVLLGACAAAPPTERSHPLIGEWGGQHIRLDLAPTGGTAQFDCAHGSIDQPVVADREGRFDAAGSFTREHGGPVRQGEVLPSFTARYLGSIDGPRMTLHIDLANGEHVGPFALKQAGSGQVYRCL